MNLKKTSVLLYGSLTYLLFHLTYLYCIGFITGFAVPKDINTITGEVPSLAKALTINISLLGLFAVQHLIMARRFFKRWITKYIPQAAERTTFVLITCLILCATFLFWQPMPTVIWDVANPIARNVLLGISLFGFGGVVITTFLIDHFELFGLKQTIQFATDREIKAPRFQVRLFYRYCRHPLYLFFFLGFWSAPTMTASQLTFALLCTGFVFIGVQFEERGLIAEHGDAYRTYKKQLPMIVPMPGRSLPSA